MPGITLLLTAFLLSVFVNLMFYPSGQRRQQRDIAMSCVREMYSAEIFFFTCWNKAEISCTTHTRARTEYRLKCHVPDKWRAQRCVFVLGGISCLRIYRERGLIVLQCHVMSCTGEMYSTAIVFFFICWN